MILSYTYTCGNFVYIVREHINTVLLKMVLLVVYSPYLAVLFYRARSTCSHTHFAINDDSITYSALKRVLNDRCIGDTLKGVTCERSYYRRRF